MNNTSKFLLKIPVHLRKRIKRRISIQTNSNTGQNHLLISHSWHLALVWSYLRRLQCRTQILTRSPVQTLEWNQQHNTGRSQLRYRVRLASQTTRDCPKRGTACTSKTCQSTTTLRRLWQISLRSTAESGKYHLGWIKTQPAFPSSRNRTPSTHTPTNKRCSARCTSSKHSTPTNSPLKSCKRRSKILSSWGRRASARRRRRLRSRPCGRSWQPSSLRRSGLCFSWWTATKVTQVICRRQGRAEKRLRAVQAGQVTDGGSERRPVHGFLRGEDAGQELWVGTSYLELPADRRPQGHLWNLRRKGVGNSETREEHSEHQGRRVAHKVFSFRFNSENLGGPRSGLVGTPVQQYEDAQLYRSHPQSHCMQIVYDLYRFENRIVSHFL